MPKKSPKRGTGISRVAKYGKSKTSSSSHLHHLSSSYNPPPPEINTTIAGESESEEQAPTKKAVTIASLGRTNKRQKIIITQLTDEKLAAEERASALAKSNKQMKTTACSKVKLLKKQNAIDLRSSEAKVTAADAKVAASLAREEITKLKCQKNVDNVVIKSKAKRRENGKLAAEVLKKDREASKKKNRELVEKFNKDMHHVNAEKEKAIAVALVLQNTLSKVQDNCNDHDTMGLDDLIDRKLEQLFCTVENKRKTRTRAIQYIRSRLDSYDRDMVVSEVNETDKKQSRVRTSTLYADNFLFCAAQH